MAESLPGLGSGRDERLQAILVEYLEAGRAPPDEKWLARHPEFAEELQAFLADRRSVDRLAARIRAVQPDPDATLAPTDPDATLAPPKRTRWDLLQAFGRTAGQHRGRFCTFSVACFACFSGQFEGESGLFEHPRPFASLLDRVGISCFPGFSAISSREKCKSRTKRPLTPLVDSLRARLR